MNVCWITRAALLEREGALFSGHAAVRMRALAPAAELCRMGHAASVVTAADGLGRFDVAVPPGCEVIIIDQLVPIGTESVDAAGARMLDLIGELRRVGIKVAADIHDHHFETDGKGGYFRRLVQSVDAVIANTAEMAQAVREYTAGPVHTIGDPYEGLESEPRFAPVVQRRRLAGWLPAPVARDAERLQLAWFGHQSNLPTIYRLAETLVPLGRRWPLRISLVCASGFGAEDFCEIFNHYHARRCRIAFLPWSPQSTAQVLQECDLVVLPSDVSSLAKFVKSANRLIESLHAGRFPIAAALPSYREFSAYAWLGRDLGEGIKWAMAHVDEVRERISAGQHYVTQHYAPGVVGGQWEKVLYDILGYSPQAPQS